MKLLVRRNSQVTEYLEDEANHWNLVERFRLPKYTSQRKL